MKKIIMLILSVIFVTQLFAQKLTVSGVVTSEEDGQSIPGTNVSIKGTSTGTITDINGKYTIKADPENILVFSNVGLQTLEVLVGNQEQINVVMVAEAKAIDEVVVIGYGTQKKSHLTGSISKLTNDNLDETSVSRLDQALIGKIAGVQIQNISAEAGAAPLIRIRGMGSVSANSSPLVVVDGHPVEDGMSFVNMSDVESVEVLKDAASSAIYGSRGANGVIIITTKSGNEDKAKYNFKTQFGVRSAYELHDIMPWSDYVVQLSDEAVLRATDPSVDPENVNLTTDADRAGYVIENTLRNGESTNWQKEGIRDIANISNYQLSISGGSKTLTYYISANYQAEDGQMYHSTYDKMSFRARVGGKLGKKIKFNINLNPTYSKTEKPSESFTDFIRFGTWLPVYHTESTAAFARQNPLWPNVKAGDWAQVNHFANQYYSGELPDGTMWTSTGPVSPSTSSSQSPKSSLERNSVFQNNYRLLSSGDLTINLAKGLDLRTSGSAYFSYTENIANSMKNATKEGDPNIRTFGSVVSVDWLNENTMNYSRKFNNHQLDVLLGITFQSRQNMNRGIYGSGFPTDNIPNIVDPSQIDMNNTYTNSETIRLISYLGRINYSYKNKYLFSTSLRRDGSSYFSSGNKWSLFPSVSAGWSASEESFLKDVDWLSLLKLRASYGVSGNNRIQNYSYTNLMYGQPTVLGSGTGQLVNGLATIDDASANENITWERTFEYNMGIDLRLLKDRINLSFEFYNSQTDQLLFKQSAMSFSGYSEYWNNIGKVQNRGFEIELATVNLSKNDLVWKTTFNFATNKNTLLELGGEPYQYSYGERNEVYAAIVGQPAIQFFGYKTDGIWMSQAEVDAAMADDMGTTISKYFAAGGLKTVDTNNDGKITPEDRVPIGNPFPKFTWGINNNFTYKSFDLNFMFQGVQGNEIVNGDANYVENRKIDRSYSANRWVSEMFPGDGKTPYVSNGQNWMLTDYVVEDGSYIALRDVILGYQLPGKWSRKLHISSLRLYASGQNLLYIMAKGYRGINPEGRRVSGDYNTPMIDGYSRGLFPIARTISMGLDINF